jgi:hypothetical protein
MDTNFCINYDIPKKIFKCCSVTNKTVFIFMNIYFQETNFVVGDKVTWLSKDGERSYGSVIPPNPKINKIKVKPTNEKQTFVHQEKLNVIHPFDETISKISDNILKKNKDKYLGISDEKIDLLKKYIGDKDIIKELFPFIKEGFEHKFIYNDMIYCDDTCSTVLKKISQYCSSIDYEDHKYIYASYFNNDDENIPLGFKYKDTKTLHPNDIINKKLCDLFDSEKSESSSNIIEKEYENIIENYDIQNNIIHFINLDDFVDKHELNTIDFKKCGDDEHEVLSFKKTIINKYWPFLINDKLSDIIGNNEGKVSSYKEEHEKLLRYSIGNKIIHGNINPSSPCDDIYINFFKTSKKQSKNLTIDLYKVFTDFSLSVNVPFVKWGSLNNQNKYYKLFKDSIVYEGYGDFESKDKFIDFKTCQEWIKDLYRSKKRSLEKINRFDIIHKEDILSFKIFSDEGTYSTLSISIDGTLDFIIKKDNDKIGISSKEQIIKLINLSNNLIQQMNSENKYSENKIEDFGTSEEIEDIFLKDNIDFIDAKVSYKKGNYEVKKGLKNADEKKVGEELIPPFVNGEKTNLFIPILRKVCNNLTMFFRYMNEDDDENINDNIIGLQYNRCNNFTNINTIQSLITVYLNKETYGEENKIINDIVRVFNIDSEIIKDEISSIKEIEGDRENYRKVSVVDEDTPDITISVRNNFIDFEIRNMKSFMEFQRITSLTKVIMMLFGKFVNNDDIFQGGDIRDFFIEDKLNIKSKIIEEEEIKEDVNDILGNMDSEESSDISSSESSMENQSSDDSSMEGGGQKGGAALRSYYLKRLKENDKKLFDPDKPWIVKQKNGDLYGYAKQCGAAIDRHPISITTEDLKRINSYDRNTSGKGSYSKSIVVPRRNKDIHYICPQYWDVSREIPLTKEYVSKHKKDIIKNKENKENNTILERKGKYWDGIPNYDSHKHILPGFSKLIIHPEGYKLPCCFSKRGLEKEYDKDDDKDEKPLQKKKKQIKKKISGKKLCKINTKESLPISIGQCSQLPKKLKIMLSQDKIFEYDPNLSISNGFIRKGIQQSESDYVFKESSFINSYIELIDYDGGSETFISEEIIKPLLSDIKYYQYCPTLHKYFRRNNLSENDKKDLKKNYIGKKFIRDAFGESKATILRNIINADELSIESNEIGYIYSLIVSLKTYIDFLRSDEEKKDEYIIPALNSISDDKINIVIFEKDDEQVKTKETEHIDSNKYCLMIKEGHYYEPIVYRVNLLKLQYEVKIISKSIFSSFEVFEKDIFKKYLNSPYPRGRDPNIRSGITPTKINNLNCKDNAKYCSEWLPYIEIKKVKKGTEIRWNDNIVEGCPNSGKKNYDKFVKEVDGNIETEGGETVSVDHVFVKTRKQVDPKLKIGLQNKNNWLWIDRDCDNIHDKDIESLIRKNYDKIGDKLLLDFSTKTIKVKSDEDILKGMESNFFIVNRILSDLEKIQVDNKINYHDIENKGIKHYINNYSEITHILYENDSNDILLPISPIKMTPLYKDIDIIYDVESYPKFKDTINYLSKLNLTIEKVVTNSKDEITCLFLEDGILPIDKEILKGQDKYDILKTDKNPFEVDKFIMSKKKNNDNYITRYKNDNEYKQKLFTKILKLIKDNESIVLGLMGIIEDTIFIRKHKVEKVFNLIKNKIEPQIKKLDGFPDTSHKLLQEFSFKLLISVENGDNISTINKIIDNVIKYSDLEKKTPNSEVFIKYVRDKEMMYNYLRDIFIKQSDFINIRKEPLFSDNNRIKTTKLKTIPYYINKLFGPDSSIVFNIDGSGGDWYNLSLALKALDIKPSNYANDIREIKGIIEGPKRKIKYIGHIQRIILYKLSELNKVNLKEKSDAFIRSYNKYNIMRYGDKHKIFNSIDDIMKYWRRDPGEKLEYKQRINKPDIELILERVKEGNLDDFGVLLISFSKGKEMDIKFYGTENINENTKVALLHHTPYDNDYILSNIIVRGKDHLTVKELYDISPIHEKWITINNDKEKRLQELIERGDKLEEMIDEGNDDIKGYQEKLSKTRKQIQELENQ